jgi:deazaflavin-dependent oxidoreductase (nitroreductase family)
MFAAMGPVVLMVLTAGHVELGRCALRCSRREGGTMSEQVRSGRRFTALEERLVSLGSRIMGRANTWLFRASGGRLGARFLYGAPVMLLTTVGRKSGKVRTSPVLYLEDGTSLVTVASKGGSAHHPGWYGNLLAHPDVEVEIGADRRRVRARTASADEKARLWPRLTAMYPPYATYQSRTDREIPVVILEPR